MQLTNLFDENDGSRAVSPVIGVILMVAITVILAAVIGTFVLGLGENISSNPTAGVDVTVDETNNKVTFTRVSSGSADSVKISDGTSSTPLAGGVGGSVTLNSGASPVDPGAEDQLVVIAVKGDEEAVIQTIDTSNVS